MSKHLESDLPRAGEASLLPAVAFDETVAFVRDLAASARQSLLLMSPGGDRTRSFLARGLSMDPQALGSGVALRGIFQHSARGHPPAAGLMRAIAHAGGAVRTTGVLPVPLLVVDGDLAVLPLQQAQNTSGAYLIRNRSVARLAEMLFEEHWVRAVSLDTEVSREPDDIGDLEASVLRMLADGKKDESVARALGISIRSLRRIIAGLMDRLGSSTRFQAGVRANERGWITRPGWQ